MRVLVTGASGFFGSHIAEQFAAEGHAVRLLLRKTSSREFLRFPYEEAIGDITDAASLTPAVANIDAIVHTAGLVKARSDAEFAAVNGTGTANLLRAIETHAPGIKRFVYISSLAAHRPSRTGTPPPVEARPQPVSAYGRTKLAGEALTRASALASQSIVFRMPVIYGPRDPALLPFFRAVRLRVVPLLDGGKGRISIVYVSDGARAVVQATTTEAPVGGQTYCPEDGVVYSSRDLLRAIEAAASRKALLVPVPLLAYEAGAMVSAAFGRLTGRAVMFTPDKVREMSQPAWVCSSEELRRDIGWEPQIKIMEGARLTHDWYREAGWL